MSVTFERRNEMPRFDGTGPNGQGPITGRGMDKCNKTQEENGNNPSFGFGYGSGSSRGMVRGRGHGCKGGMGKARGFCANAQK